ncbi:MAG: DUF2442 domain-containing protein [Oscillospiraceae bacterium]|nr:DUF2442 domain-containing protein [Oscillospiraceae bacterium]
MEYIPYVVQAVPGDGKTVFVYFSDGSVRRKDVSGLIRPGTVFAPLADDAVFRQTLTVMDGAVAWDLSGERDPRTCVDLDPIGTFESAELVDDPLAATS